jgi:predicted nucleotidyltransferase
LSIAYYEISLESVVDKLKSTLEKLPNLVIAVLFGSALRRRYVRDVDVAVYLSSEESLREIIDLSSRLEEELKLPVDVVPLREATPKLRVKILLDGIRLVVRDSNLYWLLASQALSEASDMELKYRWSCVKEGVGDRG